MVFFLNSLIFSFKFSYCIVYTISNCIVISVHNALKFSKRLLHTIWSAVLWNKETETVFSQEWEGEKSFKGSHYRKENPIWSLETGHYENIYKQYYILYVLSC